MFAAITNYWKYFLGLFTSVLGSAAAKTSQSNVVPDGWEEVVLFASGVAGATVSVLLAIKMMMDLTERIQKKIKKEP